MPALFAPSGGGASNEVVPLAQLSAGVDGSATLAKKGEQLIELLQLSFGPDEAARWAALEQRLRVAGSVDHPGVRAVFGLDAETRAVTLEGERSPPLDRPRRRDARRYGARHTRVHVARAMPRRGPASSD